MSSSTISSSGRIIPVIARPTGRAGGRSAPRRDLAGVRARLPLRNELVHASRRDAPQTPAVDVSLESDERFREAAHAPLLATAVPSALIGGRVRRGNLFPSLPSRQPNANPPRDGLRDLR
jgi:hypothetical protein